MEATEAVKAPISHPSQWWRWPLIPFASLFGALVGTAIIELLNWISLKFYGGFAPDGWMQLYALPVLSSGAFGFIYTWIAYAMAPKAKFVTGVVMISILGVVWVACVIVIWFSPVYGVGKAIFETVRLVVCTTGAVIALFTSEEQ